MRYLALILVIIAPAIVEAADYDQRMPATELQNGSANAAYRTFIRNGATCYQWGPIRACNGPSTPFGSFGGNDRDGSGETSADPGGDSDPGGSDPGESDDGGSSDPGDSGGSGNGGPGSSSDGRSSGGGRGQECRR